MMLAILGTLALNWGYKTLFFVLGGGELLFIISFKTIFIFYTNVDAFVFAVYGHVMVSNWHLYNAEKVAVETECF